MYSCMHVCISAYMPAYAYVQFTQARMHACIYVGKFAQYM